MRILALKIGDNLIEYGTLCSCFKTNSTETGLKSKHEIEPSIQTLGTVQSYKDTNIKIKWGEVN